jgi:two-component system response regulator FixJ
LIEIKARCDEARHPWRMSRSAPRPRIAIVVNDEALLNALAFSLDAEGWEASRFRTPAALLERLPALQCLLVDHSLPGMDGLELIAAVRRRGVAAPAVVIAAKPSAGFRKRAEGAGVDVVDKPLVGDELQQRIRAALDAGEAPDPGRP